MEFEKYFNAERIYNGPVMIKLEQPRTIALKDLRKFLESFKPFTCCHVYLVKRFVYGDFGNNVTAIIESRLVDPDGSRTFDGGTEFEMVDRFWNYFEDCPYPFWERKPEVGYDLYKVKAARIEDITVRVEEVYVIADVDMNKIKKEYEEKHNKA